MTWSRLELRSAGDGMELLELVLAVPSFEGDVQMFAMSLFSELLG
jgi:hypothetical protein